MIFKSLWNRFVSNMLNDWEKRDHEILSGQPLPENITEITDVPYIVDGCRGHLLDIYYPDNMKGPFPVIIDIHGGGFLYGDKELNKLYAYHLAKKGFMVFNLNYRLAYNGTNVSGQIRDIISALDWIGNSLQSYPADKGKIYLMGESAGAYLAVMAVLVSNSPRLQNVFGMEKPNITFNALAVINGFMEWTRRGIMYFGLRSMILDNGYKKQEYYRNLNLSKIPETAGLPPVFVTTNRDDGLGFMTEYFVKILKKNKVEHYYYLLKKNKQKKLGHIFNVLHPSWDESIKLNNAMVEFFTK